MRSSARKHVISFLSQMQKALPEYICRECWERHLREDLFRGCAIENEMRRGAWGVLLAALSAIYISQ